MKRPDLFVPMHMECYWSPLFDFWTFDEIPPQHEFFVFPVGATLKSYPGRMREIQDTNMYLTGQLPAPQEFYITAIRVSFTPDYTQHRGRLELDLQDLRKVLLSGVLELVLGHRRYVYDGPLAKFPVLFPTYHAESLAALMKELDGQLYKEAQECEDESGRITKLPGELYAITPIYLQRNQSFHVRVLFPEPVQLNAPGRLGVILDGYLLRPES